MKHFTKSLAVYGLLIIGLTGCGGKLIDWGTDHFYQGDPVKECVKYARCYVRTERIYDEFELVGGISALWLSNVVRENYSTLYSYLHGKNKVEEKAFLRRQIAENNHYISFYVLSANDITIGENEAHWAPFLHVDGHYYSPMEIKMVDLAQEYRLIFGHKYYTRFITTYLVKFNAQDMDGKKIIGFNTKRIELEFRSLCKEFGFCWTISAKDITMPMVDEEKVSCR